LSGLVINGGYDVFPFRFIMYYYVILNLLSRIILGMHGMYLISSLSLEVSSTSFILRWMWVKTIENAEFCSVMSWL